MPRRKREPVVTTNALGTLLVDGAPFYATVDGVPMNRRQYLDATRAERLAAVKAELEQHAKEG